MPDLSQFGILDALPPMGIHLFFDLEQPLRARESIEFIVHMIDGNQALVGLGKPLFEALGANTTPSIVLRDFPHLVLKSTNLALPTSNYALWLWLRGSDRGVLSLKAQKMVRTLSPVFAAERMVDTFEYAGGRDLTGFVDGTENPTGQNARAAALIEGSGTGLDGSSFAAIQQWVHDFEAYDRLDSQAKDNAIGRGLNDNEELVDAPPSAHIKRTAQEDFDPPAFILRRSMPWARDGLAGLLFLAFCRTLDAFEVQLRRMCGYGDGVEDGIFTFTTPVTGSYFWCPPMREGLLDLSALGL